MQNVLVYAGSDSGQLNRGALEVLAAGSRLADALGEKLAAVVCGANTAELAQAGIAHGADTVYAVENPVLNDYEPELFVNALAAAAAAADPRVVVLNGDSSGRDLAGRIAARLDASVITDAIALKVEGKSVLATRPVYGGKAIAVYAPRVERQVVMIRPKTESPAEAVAGRVGDVVKVAFEVSESTAVGRLVEKIREAVTGVKLEDARIVVAGGRGIGGPEPFKDLQSLASVLGAAVGVSRAVCDAGWMPSTHQVGQTGAIVAPDLYIAIGISGASQHLAGIGGAKMVVAINNDPEAPIFKRATLGIVADYRTVLPTLIEELRRELAS